jgi:predicted transcriptional regulator
MPSLYDRLQDEIDRRTVQPGLNPADLLELAPDVRRLVQDIARRGDASAAELAPALGVTVEEAASLLGDLEQKGLVRGQGEGAVRRYQVDFGRRPAREVPLDIWAALSDRMGG